MANLTARQVLDYTEQMVNARPVAKREWVAVKGQQACITIIRDSFQGSNYEAVVVATNGQSRITWGKNSRNLLASVKRDIIRTLES
jgi:hypothetical protein